MTTTSSPPQGSFFGGQRETVAAGHGGLARALEGAPSGPVDMDHSPSPSPAAHAHPAHPPAAATGAAAGGASKEFHPTTQQARPPTRPTLPARPPSPAAPAPALFPTANNPLSPLCRRPKPPSLPPLQVEVLFVLCALLGGRSKTEVQNRLADLHLAQLLERMFDSLDWCAAAARPSPPLAVLACIIHALPSSGR